MRKKGGTSVDIIPRQRNDQLAATFFRNENTQRQSLEMTRKTRERPIKKSREAAI